MNIKPGTAEQPSPAPAAKTPKVKPAQTLDKVLANTDREARRKAAAILEVLAGARKPSDAAQVLGITPMRYYLLEIRAIQGLVKGCEPLKLGPKVSPDKEAQRLRKQIVALERECARYAALARVAQRAVNLLPPPPIKKAPSKKGRRHKPPVRAFKVLTRVQASLEAAGTPAQATAEHEVAAIP
jgi:hypothetical protein